MTEAIIIGVVIVSVVCLFRIAILLEKIHDLILFRLPAPKEEPDDYPEPPA